MCISKDYVFAYLRDQRSTENVSLQRISDTIQLLFSNINQNDIPRYSVIEGTRHVLGTIHWEINFRLEEVEHELAYIDNNDARCIRPFTAIELAGYPQYLAKEAEAEQNTNGLNQQAQGAQVPGIKKRPRSVDDDDYMVKKKEPKAKQPRQIAEPRLSRFQRANSNSQAVSNNGVVALEDNLFSDIRAIAPPPQQQQQQQQQLGNAARVNATNVALPPAGDDDMDMDVDGNMETNGDMDRDMKMEL